MNGWSITGLVGIALGAGWAGLAGLGFAFQRQMLFPAPRATTPFPASDDFRWIAGPTGARIPIIYRPAPGNGPVVVFFHGNGEQLTDLVDLAPLLARRGAGLLAPEYPGYGFAKGSPSETSIYAWAEAALDWLRTENVPVERTVLAGHSLGTGVAVEMARRGLGVRMVLLSAYTSIPDVAARMLPFLPVRRLVRDRFDSLSKAEEVRIPVLMLHGTRDRTVPIALGRQLSERFPDARFESLEGVDHQMLREDVLLRMAEFAVRPGPVGSHPQ